MNHMGIVSERKYHRQMKQCLRHPIHRTLLTRTIQWNVFSTSISRLRIWILILGER